MFIERGIARTEAVEYLKKVIIFLIFCFYYRNNNNNNNNSLYSYMEKPIRGYGIFFRGRCRGE